MYLSILGVHMSQIWPLYMVLIFDRIWLNAMFWNIKVSNVKINLVASKQNYTIVKNTEM